MTTKKETSQSEKAAEKEAKALITSASQNRIQELMSTLSAQRLTGMKRVDLKQVAKQLTRVETGELSAAYMTVQRQRVGYGNRMAQANANGKPELFTALMHDSTMDMEETLLALMKEAAVLSPLGRWLCSVKGIGPVIACGIIGGIDWDITPHESNLRSLAGYGQKQWKKGHKCPWSPRLKKYMYYAGMCFMKVSGREGAVYGKHYLLWKDKYTALNEQGQYADYCEAEKHRYGATTVTRKCMEQGKLSPSHIVARARAKAICLFLSHVFEVGKLAHTGKLPSVPFIFANKGHSLSSYVPPTFSDKIPEDDVFLQVLAETSLSERLELEQEEFDAERGELRTWLHD